MLNIKRNRLIYGDLLSPPEGFELTKAVGTTFTLDLYALLAIPVAMFYAKSMEGDFKQNRYDVLDAIRKSKSKVDLFCQKGKINVPSKYSNLLAFMEDCIIEITPDRFNASFHPKLWAMRFENGKDVLYRLIVLSRNLTFDRSMDIAYHAEGSPSITKDRESQKLSSYLQHFYRRSKQPTDQKFFDALERVAFNVPDNFLTSNYYPILGFENNLLTFPNPLKEVSYSELLIISPFVDKKTIKQLKANNKKLYLVSREEELDKLDSQVLEDIESYFLNSIIVEGERYIDSEGKEILLQNLHAKIFIGQNKKETDWFLGSANCTAPAFERNAEFLLKLQSAHRSTSLSFIKQQLLLDPKSVFCRYHPKPPKEEVEEENIAPIIRKLNFHLINSRFTGDVKKSDTNENYDVVVKVNLESWPDDRFTVKARIIHRKEKGQELYFGKENSLIFKNIAITNLSKFLVLDIFFNKEKYSSSLIKIDINVPQEREDIIFNNLIDSKLKFFQYIQFLLSPEQYNGIMEILEEDNTSSNNAHSLNDIFHVNAPIYEYLMLAASRSPKKLIEIDQIVNRLLKADSDIVTDFLPIWNVFKEFAHE